jgi:hypothetical protein
MLAADTTFPVFKTINVYGIMKLGWYLIGP